MKDNGVEGFVHGLVLFAFGFTAGVSALNGDWPLVTSLVLVTLVYAFLFWALSLNDA